MKSLLLFVSAQLLFCISASSQTTVAKRQSVSATVYSTQRFNNLDKAMNDWVQNGWMNGGVGLIMQKGKIIYYKSAGYNAAKSQPLSKDDLFRIASQTKAVTSVAVMMLFDAGKLLLSDPVSNYIPSFKNQTVLKAFNEKDSSYTTEPVKREVTIKDLLTHTSGLGYAQIGSKEANAIYGKNNITAGLGVQDQTLLGAITRLGKLPLMHQPGEKWTYGLNSDVLGCLVEIISGQSLSDFFTTRIFKPLGMNDTYFNVPKEKASRLVTLYMEDSTGKLNPADSFSWNGPILINYPLTEHKYFSGGAGLTSTAYDYALFLQMLLNGGELNGQRLLGRNTVRMMTMNQIGDLSLGDDKFGLGFAIVTEKGSADVPAQVGTFSWGGAFSTSYWVDPKEKLVLLFYRQMLGGTHNEVVERFRALAYAALN
ncbi:MAG: serine hydrolase domain-containing protein [Ginsengibacter sp.]